MPAPSPLDLTPKPPYPYTWKYNIRPARLSDAVGISFVHLEGFRKSCFTETLFPNRFKYLLEYIQALVYRHSVTILSPRQFVYVAYPEGKEEEVVGFAIFSRYGPSNDPVVREIVKRRDSWWTWFWRWYYGLRGAIYRFFLPISKIQHMEHYRIFMKERERYESEIWTGDYDNQYHCNGLIVLPAWERKGMATRLMKIGMELAEEEAVPLGLEATTEGDPLYRKLGFKMIEPYTIKTETGGGLMVWEPENYVGDRRPEIEVRKWEEGDIPRCECCRDA